MREVTLEFNFKARFYQSCGLNEHTQQVWFVLHGYGYLARYFAKKFESLQHHGICVIAPEGLSRFYLEAVEKRAVTGNKRVGATWMTAENRVMDIENYLQYLDQVHKIVMEKWPKIPVTLLGFSQGAATASRWAIHRPSHYNRLILWSGIFPPDMDFKKSHDVLSTKTVAMVYGTADPYLTESRLKEMSELQHKLGLQPDVHTFSGGHDIDEPTLLKFV